MGMVDAKAAFNRGLGAAGNCTEAIMDYDNINRVQVFQFTVNVKSGGRQVVSVNVAPSEDPNEAARAAAAAFSASLEA